MSRAEQYRRVRRKFIVAGWLFAVAVAFGVAAVWAGPGLGDKLGATAVLLGAPSCVVLFVTGLILDLDYRRR